MNIFDVYSIHNTSNIYVHICNIAFYNFIIGDDNMSDIIYFCDV